MTSVQVTLEVPSEVKAIGDGLQTLVAGLIAKKGITEIAAEVFPSLLAAGAAIAEAGADLKTSPDARAYLAVVIERAIDSLLAPKPTIPTVPVV